MVDFLIEKMSDTRFLAMLFAAVAAAATVLTLAMPLFASDNLGRRMKAVALEREKIRQRERERMVAGQKVSLRRSPKQFMKTAVEQFNLAKWGNSKLHTRTSELFSHDSFLDHSLALLQLLHVTVISNSG